MKLEFDQSHYWDSVASQKVFNHSLNIEWLSADLITESSILDYGCGQGRLVKELGDAGYENVLGMDSSGEMIAEGRKRLGLTNLIHNPSHNIPLPDNSQSLVLLFAVLTCIPKNADQQALISEIQRILTPEGKIYISDLLLNDDKRNLDRYNKGKEKFDAYGTFELPEGVVCRHHTSTYLKEKLLSAFEIQREHTFEVKTMNGNRSNSIQIFATLR